VDVECYTSNKKFEIPMKMAKTTRHTQMRCMGGCFGEL
jgi:hypothetical protein